MNIEEMNSWGLTQSILEVIENGFSFNEESGEVYFTENDLKELKMQLDVKLNSICGYIKLTEAKAEALKKRKEEVAASQKRFENKAKKLNEYLAYLLKCNNIEKEKVLNDYVIKFKKSDVLKITDEEKVKKYIKDNNISDIIKVSEELSKKELKSFLKENNLKIDGAENIISEKHSIS